jgi:hypothetical protein
MNGDCRVDRPDGLPLDSKSSRPLQEFRHKVTKTQSRTKDGRPNANRFSLSFTSYFASPIRRRSESQCEYDPQRQRELNPFQQELARRS